jgi:4-diphosphocytidyl-2-C-methyl-D-erythritol kinase
MRWFRAPAKINLHLCVLARRLDGLHEIESLVAFSEIGDWVGFWPGERLELDVEGPTAHESGPCEQNLVMKAARALATLVPNLRLGRFRLVKRLPAAAGLGGGSSDAAAALAALAEANGLSREDERLRAAAAETGADVPACLFPEPRWVQGVGERVGAPVALPNLFAVLANPRIPAPTRDVFEALGLVPGSRFDSPERRAPAAGSGTVGLEALRCARNDLQSAAIRVVPAVESTLQTLARLPGAIASRMTGSGATCFALFDSALGAATARRMVAAEQPEWWIRASSIR